MGFRLSTCPYCACGCGLLLETREGRLLGSHPSQGHPVANGSLCIRGWNCTDSLYRPDRLLSPMLRRSGQLSAVAWHDALAEIVERLEKARSGRPPSAETVSDAPADPAILFVVGPTLANEDAFAASRLAGLLGAAICGVELEGVPVAHRALTSVAGRAHGLQHPEMISGADVVWLFAADMEDAPQIWAMVQKAARNGAGIVVFDACGASALSPATVVTLPADGPRLLPLLLQRAAVEDGRIPARVRDAPGFASLADGWRTGQAPLLSEHPWLPDDLCRELVGRFVEARNPAVVIGRRWLSWSEAERQTFELVQALSLLGADDRVAVAAGEVNSWGVTELLRQEGGQPSPLLDLLDPQSTRSFSALFVLGTDILRRTPRPDILRERLRQIDTVVLADSFANDTLAYAHAVLPTPAFPEADGTTINAFGSVQRWRQALPSPDESCTYRSWMARIGSAIGIGGWPATDAEWTQAMQAESSSLGSAALPHLYESPASYGVPLATASRFTFDEPRLCDAPARPPEFPFWLIFKSHSASWSDGALSERQQLLHRESIESRLHVSREDMKRAGLKHGWQARVITPDGEALLTVHEDSRLPSGMLRAVLLAGSEAESITGFRAGSERRTLAVQPLPARIEKA
jgi:anaerobic selenocysteine-containing dehydrogenase